MLTKINESPLASPLPELDRGPPIVNSKHNRSGRTCRSAPTGGGDLRDPPLREAAICATHPKENGGFVRPYLREAAICATSHVENGGFADCTYR